MSTARDFLAAVQQRADDPRAKYHHKPCSAPVCGSRHCQTARDRDALLAALTAALDDTEPGNLVVDEDASWVAGYRDAMRDIREAIDAALTPKENDS